MLKKRNRFDRKREFEEVMEKGRLMQSPFFGLKIIDSSENKFGFIISRKISKKAVERNKIKRILAETVREKIKEGLVSGNVVFLVKRKALEVSAEELKKEVERLLGKDD